MSGTDSDIKSSLSKYSKHHLIEVLVFTRILTLKVSWLQNDLIVYRLLMNFEVEHLIQNAKKAFIKMKAFSNPFN